MIKERVYRPRPHERRAAAIGGRVEITNFKGITRVSQVKVQDSKTATIVCLKDIFDTAALECMNIKVVVDDGLIREKGVNTRRRTKVAHINNVRVRAP